MREQVTLKEIYKKLTNRERKFLDNLIRLDELTGVYNRRAFEEDIERVYSRARRRRRDLTVLFADVDHFKRVNDKKGHSVGDTVLREVAESLGDVLRTPDTRYRYGGEEFVIVLEDTDTQGGLVVAERCRAHVATTCFVERPDWPVTLSVGLATRSAAEFDEDYTASELVKQADQAVYLAKLAGRNRVEQYRKP